MPSPQVYYYVKRKTFNNRSRQIKWTIFSVPLVAIAMIFWQVLNALVPTTDTAAENVVGNEKHPCMTMPIPELLAALVEDDETAAIWGTSALALRPDEAVPHIENMLQKGTPWQQYSLARKLKDIAPECHTKTLMTLATSSATHPQARIGAFYALSNISLSPTFTTTLLSTAQNSESPVLRQTALIALASSDISNTKGDVKPFLHHSDPLTRTYAARLLLEQGEAIPPDAFIMLASNEDYLLRQEAYGVLGYYYDPMISAFLQNAAATETNRSAARSARLALLMQRIRSLPDNAQQEQALLSLLDMNDKHEQWQAVQYAMRHHKALGIKVLASLAQSDSVLGETSRAQLIALNADDTPLHIPAISNKHATTIHKSMAHYNVALHNTQPAQPKINAAIESIFAEAIVLEDIGMTPVNHAYNPLTGRGFLWRKGFGGSAQLYAARLFDRLESLCAQPDFSQIELSEAWVLAARVFHVLQDMTSPLHVFGVWHVLNGCHFENYWHLRTEEALRLIDEWDMQPVSLPGLPPAATAGLDAYTHNALEQRVDSLSNTLGDYQDALAWSAYYRASFWGEIRYSDETTIEQTTPTIYDDGETEALPNILSRMFEGNIRYHPSWWGDYFEITDRLGNTFAWNRIFALDEWRPCPNPRKKHSVDGHASYPASHDDSTMRITGRFFFTHKGEKTPYCYPFTYPDGTPMTDHLVYYYGANLFPVTAAYNGGWLSALAKQYPKMFAQETFLQEKDDISGNEILNNFRNIFGELLSGSSSGSLEEHSFEKYLRVYVPRCGCAP